MRLLSLLAPLLFGPFILWASAESGCLPLTGEERTKLANYVEKKYALPESTGLEVEELEVTEESCYQKVRFRSPTGQRRFRIDLYVSPDHRFLSREIMDSRLDPEAQARSRASRLVTPDAASLGSKSAPVTLVLFSDFECPFCSQMAEGLVHDILPAQEGKVRLVFRNFPLEGHPWARAAAEAMECAQAQADQYFWVLHEYVFAHQRDFNSNNVRSKLLEQASKIDRFDQSKFEDCVDDRATASKIENDLAFGREMEVTSTPTLFINGQRVSGYRPVQIKTLIREQLSVGTARDKASSPQEP